MNNYLRSALEILKKAKSPMHYKEITDKVIDEGLLETTGRTPSQTMNHYLRKYDEYFTDKKGKKGEYSLKISTKEINSIIKEEGEKEQLDRETEKEKIILGRQENILFVLSL